MNMLDLANCLGIVGALSGLRESAPWDKESINDLIYVCDCTALDTGKIDYLQGCATVFADDAELLDDYLGTASELVARELSRVSKFDLTDLKTLQFVFLISSAYKHSHIQTLVATLCSPLALETSDDAISQARATPAGELLLLMAGALTAQEQTEVLH